MHGLWLTFAITGLFGFGLGPSLMYYLAAPNGPQVVATALAGTGVIFLALSGYALTTRKDFSFMGGFLITGLIVVFGAILVNLFVAIPALSLAIAAIGMLILQRIHPLRHEPDSARRRDQLHPRDDRPLRVDPQHLPVPVDVSRDVVRRLSRRRERTPPATPHDAPGSPGHFASSDSDMDWMTIGSALLVGLMLVLLLPRARQMLKESPKGSRKDWMGALLPLGAVVLFVILLMAMV